MSASDARVAAAGGLGLDSGGAGVPWRGRKASGDIISVRGYRNLIVASGDSIHEGAACRIAFELNRARRYVSRPHPGKETKRYQVKDVRNWFNGSG
ncbi:hypothetical protein [Burkholderia multivorans]|uniref:hypothetical protein n=1 Tax=Burkholderia multivorans TaxID=87883 RepID=UPI001E53BF28|nr:hypothetical protein [Burkholderia multivorans]